MHVNTAGIREQLILRKRKPAIFQKDFPVPPECHLLLYLDAKKERALYYHPHVENLAPTLSK